MLAIAGGILYFLSKFMFKKQRRRVSFMGEQVATNAVKTLQSDTNYNRNDSYDYFT